MNKQEKIKQLKCNKGITLIALVVTIIVLIILAGVSISLVLGDNGIITKAKEAKENTEIAKVEEETQLNETVEYLENIDIKPGESGYQGGNYDDPYIPVGFEHTEGTWNDGYTIKDGLGNEFVWVPCVTDVSKIKQGDNVEIFRKTLPSTTDATDPYYKYNTGNLTIIGEEGTTPSEIETSVGIYSGFYIARYEAGIEGIEENYDATTETAKTDLNVKPLSQAGKGIWNYISRADAIIVSENMIDTETTGVKSSLISAACWDTTLQWMVNTCNNATNEPNLGYDIDSTGKGWYEKEDKTTTGQYAVNNIYDMAGNIYELTTENLKASSTNQERCVRRGGRFANAGSEASAAVRAMSHSSSASVDVGFRVVLYK